MTKNELRQLVLDLDQLCQRLPQDERGMMWHAVLTSLALDMGAAYQGRPPSEWFDKVAGVALMDVTTTMSERNSQDPGPVMATTTPGEA